MGWGERKQGKGRGKNPLENNARLIVKYLGYGFLYTTYVFLFTKTFISKEKEKPNKDDQTEGKTTKPLAQKQYYQ
jgi:hypothetical protein